VVLLRNIFTIGFSKKSLRKFVELLLDCIPCQI
jgi:hypothetical protein